ncbi:DUF393 domain-containing protein [Pseudomonadales bacterium]|jgi:predicted DCC family thiol-disulfide oxidoreductase YuxK|nr:DUF393 domain-containing protein [Pseudomonadales bacterium]MDC0997025.1 DUF393 domain-containing protein [Pseudomonadales bacterium]
MNKLYYDGKCPLCSAEMARLRVHKSTDLSLVDIHETKMNQTTKEKMLKVLHFEDDAGNYTMGLEANIAAWEGTRWSPLWRCLKLPVVRSIAKFAYDKWAEIRYARLYMNNEQGKAGVKAEV